ncbi:unnamed protein product [Sympodiomycopsis kandeliae]
MSALDSVHPGSTASTQGTDSMLARLSKLTTHLASSTKTLRNMTTSTSANPRWKQVIGEDIARGFKEGEKSSVLYYTLATIEPATGGKPATPHARYVVHRGFVNEQRSKDSPSGVEPHNPDFGSNTLLLTTTDVRAPKAKQIVESAKEGGANGEICWWHESSQTQFRLTGVFHLLPTQSHPLFSSFKGERLSPPSAQSSKDGKPFDWVQERWRIFSKLSPGLLASFARPIPGSDHPNQSQFSAFGKGDGAAEGEDGKDDKNSPWPLELPQPGKEENEEQKKLLKESEANFALLVFEPHRVDLVDLGRDQRSIFERQGDSPNATWSEKRVVP